MPPETPTDPLDAVQLADLEGKSLDYQRWHYRWRNYRLLHAGGEEFIAASGEQAETRAHATYGPSSFVDFLNTEGRKRRRRFLWQLDAEPDTKYASRWEMAHYTNYFGAILNYFRHWLFSQPPQIRVQGGGEVPSWWAGFSRDCTGGGKDFSDFLKDSFLETLITRRSGWLIGGPPVDPTVAAQLSGQFISQATARDLGLDRVSLTHYVAEEIEDEQRDATGRLLWVKLHKVAHIKSFPGQLVKVDYYTYVDRQRWRQWRVESDPARRDKPKQVEMIGNAVHGLGEVPFVLWELPNDLWMSNSLAASAVSIFNRTNLLVYGQLIGCYPQPWMRTNNPDGKSEMWGDQFIIHLRGAAGPGFEGEDFGWKSPDVSVYATVQESIDNAIKELYRVVHQMSLAVDATAMQVGQSGVSKQEDRRAAEIILCAFGGYVREVAVLTLNLVSRVMAGMGLAPITEWTVDGFDNFQVSSLLEELQQAQLLASVDIPSKTFEAALKKDIATGRLLHVDEETKQKINEEIGDAVERKYAAAMPPQVIGEGAAMDANGQPIAAEAKPEIVLTPTMQGAIITVNEARQSMGLGPLMKSEGVEDPRGHDTISSLMADAAPEIAAATAAAQGATAPTSEPRKWKP